MVYHFSIDTNYVFSYLRILSPSTQYLYVCINVITYESNLCTHICVYACMYDRQLDIQGQRKLLKVERLLGIEKNYDPMSD